MDINSKTVLIDSLITSTWYTIRKDIIDQVFQITPFYDKMMSGGRIKQRAPDGTHWEIPVRYAKQDQNRKWFGRGDTFGRTEKESETRLMYYIKYVGTSIPRFWVDDQKNRSKAKLYDYAIEKVENAKSSLIDGFENDMLVQNSDPLAMDALPTLISSTPTVGSVGGLARSTNDYLQNNIKSFANLTTGVSLLDEMTRMYNLCTLWKSGTKRAPDLILTTREVYQDYERICRAMQVIQTSKTERASLGFGDLMFKNTEMFWAPQCPAGTMYMLNTETLELDYDPSIWFSMTDWKAEANNLDRTCQIVCACNMICTNFRKNGVIFNITTTTA